MSAPSRPGTGVRWTPWALAPLLAGAGWWFLGGAGAPLAGAAVVALALGAGGMALAARLCLPPGWGSLAVRPPGLGRWAAPLWWLLLATAAWYNVTALGSWQDWQCGLPPEPLAQGDWLEALAAGRAAQAGWGGHGPLSAWLLRGIVALGAAWGLGPDQVLLGARWSLETVFLASATMWALGLGLATSAAWLLLGLLSWAMLPMRLGWGVMPATYLNAIFFLWAGAVIRVGGRRLWLVAALATLNHQLGALIPLWALASGPGDPAWRRRAWWAWGLAAVILALLWLGWSRPQDALTLPAANRFAGLLAGDPLSWRPLFYTLGPLPILATWAWRGAAGERRRGALGVGLVWLVAQTLCWRWHGPQDWLLPLALCLGPGVLAGLARAGRD